MIIKSITLENFRQYKDRTTIQFASGKERNVTVFTGDNSHGKSTLIQAFIWTIYNQDKLELDFPEDILNKDTLKHMNIRDTAKVSVEIVLIHGGIEYTFLRAESYVCTDLKKVKPMDRGHEYSVWYTDNNQKIRSKEEITIREKILPEDLAGYFFFDGEHIKKLNQKKNLRRSIAKLLGLLPLQNAVKHLSKVSENINRTIPRDGNDNLKIATSNADNAFKAIESFESQKEHIASALNQATTNYESAQKQLSEIRITSGLIDEKKKLNEKLKSSIEQSEFNLIECSKRFNEGFFNVLSKEVMEECRKNIELIEKERIADEAIPHMHADSIRYILQRGRCICGTELASHPELIAHIEELSNLLPPHSIGTELATFSTELETRLESISPCISSFDSSYDLYLDKLQTIDQIESRIKEIDSELNGVDSVAIDSIRQQYLNSERIKKQHEQQLNEIESNLKFHKKELHKAEKEIERILNLDEKYNKPRICKKYVDQLAQDIDSTRETKEVNMLKEFRNTLQEVFSEMYHGERDVYVDDDYNVHLFVPGIGETSISEGTESVLGFAYVCSLLKLALEQMDDPELASEPHTLVMDAPTSTQDDKHIANVFRYTASITDQIILFINNKDWRYVKPVLESKIEKVYELKKVNEIITQIREIE